MSSILRALKKLDEDAALEQKEGLQKLAMKQMVNRRARVPVLTYRVAVVLSILLLVIVAGWVFWSPNTPSPAQAQSATLLSIPSTHTASHINGSNQNSKPLPSAGNLSTAGNSIPVHSTSNTDSSLPPKVASPMIGNNPSENATDQLPSNHSQDLPIGSGTQGNLHTSGSQSQAEGEEGSGGGMPLLRLNGILWSDIPERRQAMIDNTYFNEGDQIKGVTILRIEKKSVVLKSGTKQWTIQL